MISESGTLSQFPSETSNPPQSAIPFQKRNKGGQPGNTNALKHGRYLAGYRLRNAAQVEVHIPDINELIETIRRFIHITFEAGLQSDNLTDSNQTLRSISLAVIGLVRLINLSQKINNSRVAPVLDQPSLETSKALIAKYRQLRADSTSVPDYRETS
jgi:hypothetical protein